VEGKRGDGNGDIGGGRPPLTLISESAPGPTPKSRIRSIIGAPDAPFIFQICYCNCATSVDPYAPTTKMQLNRTIRSGVILVFQYVQFGCSPSPSM